MKLIWSPLAAERLNEVYNYIAVDNEFAAKKVVERIFKKVGSLDKNPGREEKFRKQIEWRSEKCLKVNIEPYTALTLKEFLY